MKKIIFLSMLLFSLMSVAQDYYEVIIMPKKFDFLTEENQYNLNVLCKSFFEKEGFKVYYTTDNLPKDIANNRCNALFLDLEEESNMFKTKIKVELKDCQNNTVTFSEEGESRDKSFDRAYNEATRIALVSLRGFTKFKNPNSSKIAVSKNEVEVTKIEEPEIHVDVNPIKINDSNSKGLNSEITKNGYNLVDENKNIKFELLKTSNPTIFIAKKGNFQGIFTLNGMNSKFESYQNNELVVEKVEVKF
ncbi:hypothetical protein [uncultured Flavobacterium sp.]|mgnify:CR=1 FL=1|uniref:hypothetical protein n=1 Tax=uncultured Flavobacterium sp. TaxID=165435 RepID=UPI0030ED18AC|tara:strand:- start:21837 stop:22580 length:744 start_codon:yes stop_codon:yes gene_type:complete